MSAVTQRISSYLGGVSRQADDKKLPGQVKECINGYPDPTFGLTKRPGFRWVANLGTGTTFDNARWFYIHRDDDEKYIGCIKPAIITVASAGGGDNATDKVNVPTDISGLTVDLTAEAAGGVTKVVKMVVNTAGIDITNGATVTVSASDAGTTQDVVGTIALGGINIWNGEGGAACTVTLDTSTTVDAIKYLTGAQFNYDVLSVQDTSIITNNLFNVAKLPDPTTFVSNSQATLVLADSAANSTYSVTMKNLTGGAKRTISVTSTAVETYDGLLANLKAGIEAFASDKGVINFTITNAGTGYSISSPPAVTIAAPSSGTTATAIATVDSAGLLESITLTNSGNGYTSAPTVTIAAPSSGTTATATCTVTNATDRIVGLTVDTYPFSLEVNRSVGFHVTCTGGPANNKLIVFQDQVDNISLLPTQSKHDHIIKIINTSSDSDSYFAKFIADDGVSGLGFWEETLDPSKSTGLNAATMPHELINTAKNTFKFQQVSWTSRLVGDDVTNDHPSFVDNKIQQAFFHNNRLGFLSKDNVALSQSGEFYNFYFTSAQTIVDTDPVDLSCSSIKPAALHAVIPTTQGLVLFSKNQQFMMSGNNGVLTPTTTVIKTIASYQMEADIDPVDMGTNINFVSKTPSYTRIFGMLTRGQEENPQVLDIGRVVNEWVPSTIDTLIASPQNQFIAMSSQSSDKIYLYRTYSNGEEIVVQSWFNWQLPGNVQAISADSDDMFTVTKQASQYTLMVANLSQSPDDAIIVNTNGQRVNPCVDLYATATSVVWDATNELSKCYLPYNDVTGLTPVLIVSGSTASGSFVQSGFTITPERNSDGNGAYFEVPRNNLTSVADNVIVGFKYDLDVILPRTYFRLQDQQADYTASLTVSRMKFAVGLSGIMAFKLKSTGRLAGEKRFKGDGTTIDYGWTQADIKYIDRNQIKVKNNNVLVPAADYSFLSDESIRFSTAPDENDDILIYLDERYFLNPVQKANTYLADDIALDDLSIFTLPIHQRAENFQLRIFNDSPFPVSLNSMSWEGNYTPRYYRRA